VDFYSHAAGKRDHIGDSRVIESPSGPLGEQLYTDYAGPLDLSSPLGICMLIAEFLTPLNWKARLCSPLTNIAPRQLNFPNF
jgi:hypothetical protein